LADLHDGASAAGRVASVAGGEGARPSDAALVAQLPCKPSSGSNNPTVVRR